MLVAKRKGISAEVLDIDQNSLPYEDNSFDLVISSEVIEHVLVPDRILTEAYRVLKDGGKFILTTPNLASLARRGLLLLNRNPFIECSPYEKDAVGHLRYFVKSSLLSLVERHGFKLVKHASDVINFDRHGRVKSHQLAKIFPSLGRSIIFVLTAQSQKSR